MSFKTSKDPRVEIDKKQFIAHNKSNPKGKPSRPKTGSKTNGRKMRRPQSGKVRARVRFSMDLDTGPSSKKQRPRSAGQQRWAKSSMFHQPSPYASNIPTEQKHPDLLRYAKYSEKSNVPKPVRSAKESENIHNNGQLPTSPRIIKRNGMSLKFAAEAY